MKQLFLLLSLVAVTGCGTTGIVKGRYVDADDRGIGGAEVTLWRVSPVMYLAPVLPARVATAKTNAEGRFEVVAQSRATGLSAQGGGGQGSANLWWWSREVVVKMKPYPPRDYAEMNRECPHSPEQAVSVLVRGHVARPGAYVLKASDSVWTLIEAAGGPTSPEQGQVEMKRNYHGGIMVHYVDWTRRAEAIGEPLLCDGDEIFVGHSFR
jgi:hypothetical protein